MKSPLIILIELFIGLIRSMLDTMQFTVVKLIELFISLGFIAGTSPFGLIVAVAIGTVVLLFALKYVFGSSKELILFVLVAAALLAIAILVGSSAMA